MAHPVPLVVLHRPGSAVSKLETGEAIKWFAIHHSWNRMCHQ
jgi:hypothetical protein